MTLRALCATDTTRKPGLARNMSAIANAIRELSHVLHGRIHPEANGTQGGMMGNRIGQGGNTQRFDSIGAKDQSFQGTILSQG